MLVIIASGIVVPLVNARRRRRAAQPAATAAPPSAGGWRLDGTTAVSLVVALVATWALWQSRHFGPRAGLFPWAVMN